MTYAYKNKNKILILNSVSQRPPMQTKPPRSVSMAQDYLQS